MRSMPSDYAVRTIKIDEIARSKAAAERRTPRVIVATFATSSTA